jgi:hypothetical protein
VINLPSSELVREMTIFTINFMKNSQIFLT